MAHATTPTRKIVRWAAELANSSLGSPPYLDPSLNDASLDSGVDGDHGGLAIVNAQLLAHGFAHGSGINLDGLDALSAKTVVKCIMSLLSQRANDVSRAEDLTAKYRTLSYDYERLLSQHRTQLNLTARAEQDTQRFKARLAIAQRDCAAAESARKAAAVELKSTRTAMQYLRTTAQQESKRMEKDRQALVDRFNKISDAQHQLGNCTAGIRMIGVEPANVNATTFKASAEVELLETSLQAADEARQRLIQENDGLRDVLLDAANKLQDAVYDAQVMKSGPDRALPEMTSITAGQLFSPPTSTLTNAENAQQKVAALSSNLRDALSAVATMLAAPTSTSPNAQDTEASEARNNELKRMQRVVEKLTAELDQAKADAKTFAAQSQAMFDRLANDEATREPAPADRSADMSIDVAQINEQLQAELEEQRMQLDEERRTFTEAAIGLGRQRADLEAAKLAFMEEKRSWQVQQILSEMPPNPAPAPSVRSPPKVIDRSSPKKRISATFAMPSIPYPSSSLDELLRPSLSPTDATTGSSTDTIGVPAATKVKSPRRSPKSVKHVSFVAGKSPMKRHSPPRPRYGTRSSVSPPEIFQRNSATRLKHAYSPARPSPLSRIMLLADDSEIVEEEEGEEEYEDVDDPPRQAPAFMKSGPSHDEMFPPLPSSQTSPTRSAYPPLPENLAVELQLGASGRTVRRTRPIVPHPSGSSLADTSFPPPSNLGRVSFDFAAAELLRPASPAPLSDEEDQRTPPSNVVGNGKGKARARSLAPGNSSDELDDDLRIVKGSKPKAAATTNKENRPPRHTTHVAPVATRLAPAPKARMPLSPRKMNNKKSATTSGGAAKRVPVAAAKDAASALPRRISPVPPVPAATSSKPQARQTIGKAQRVTVAAAGWR